MNQTLDRFDLLGQIMGKSLQDFMDLIIDAEEANRYNQIQWTKFFSWGEMQWSTVFSVLEADVELFPMASVIDVNSPKPKRATQGVSLWNGEVPKIGHGFDITEKDIRQHMLLIEAGGVPSSNSIMNLFYNTANKTEFGIHARLNQMAMQIVSTGSLLINAANNPDGIVLNKIAMHPDTNKFYAGFDNGTSAVWTDPTATPLTDIQDMLDTYRLAGMSLNGLALYFDETLWVTFMRHPNVIKEVNYRKNLNVASPTTEAEVRSYLSEMGFPPVIIIDEMSGLQVDGVTSNIRSWDQSNVVLAPVGDLGEVKNAKPISVNGTVTRTAFTENGRIKIVEKADDSRVTQGFEAELNGMPVLTKAKQIYIIDTSTTTAWT